MRRRIIGGSLRHVAGWKPPAPHHRLMAPYMPTVPPEAIRNLPELVDLETVFPPVNDQGQAGTCLSNAFAEIMEQCEHPSALAAPTTEATPEAVASASIALASTWRPFSRRFIYAIGRQEDGVPLTEDSGLAAVPTLNALRRRGVCWESTMPYSDDPAAIAEAPSPEAAAEAELHKPLFGFFCPAGYTMLARIAEGFGVAFGMSLPASFESNETLATGIVQLPADGEPFIGGHEMVAIGYKRTGDYPMHWLVKVRNSWGTDVGVRGNFYIPLGYWIMGLAEEPLTISRVQL